MFFQCAKMKNIEGLSRISAIYPLPFRVTKRQQNSPLEQHPKHGQYQQRTLVFLLIASQRYRFFLKRTGEYGI
jgi:hypothetical protein